MSEANIPISPYFENESNKSGLCEDTPVEYGGV